MLTGQFDRADTIMNVALERNSVLISNGNDTVVEMNVRVV